MKNILDLREKCNNILERKWIRCCDKGAGSAGLLFERLIGIPKNNFEIADYNGIEIKTKVSKKENYISLFCAAPDGYLFEVKRIYETYAYNNGNSKFKSFNITAYGNKKVYIKNNKFCRLKIDYENKKIVLIIMDNAENIIDNKISWSFDMLKQKLERKLKYLLLVNGDRKFENRKVYYKFTKYKFYILKDFQDFLDGLEKGYIRISFTIGTFKSGTKMGQMHDHGTCFNIHKDKINHIYNEIIF